MASWIHSDYLLNSSTIFTWYYSHTILYWSITFLHDKTDIFFLFKHIAVENPVEMFWLQHMIMTLSYKGYQGNGCPWKYASFKLMKCLIFIDIIFIHPSNHRNAIHWHWINTNSGVIAKAVSPILPRICLMWILSLTDTFKAICNITENLF